MEEGEDSDLLAMPTGELMLELHNGERGSRGCCASCPTSIAYVAPQAATTLPESNGR
jgi:hypothetical protein